MSGSFICYVAFHGYEVDGDDDNDDGTDIPAIRIASVRVWELIVYLV